MKTISAFSAVTAVYTLLFFFPLQLFSQIGIESVVPVYIKAAGGTNYNGKGAQGSTFTEKTYKYRYGTNSGFTDNQMQIASFTAGGKSYSYFNPFSFNIKFKRKDNDYVTGKRDLLFYEGTVDNSSNPVGLKIKRPYANDMEAVFLGNDDLKSGTDNMFANAGDFNGNNNNIERLDVIMQGSYTISSSALEGISLFERGVYGAHDPFAVAVITAVDQLGNPTQYSAIKRITPVNYNTTTGENPVSNFNVMVLRKEDSESKMLVSVEYLNQGVGGVLIKFSEFGIPSGTTIYGYSVFGNDLPLNAAPADLLDINNETFFPSNTNSSTGEGGLDMVAITGFVKRLDVLPLLINHIDVKLQQDDVHINWSCSEAEANTKFFIERSTNGTQFAPIHEVSALLYQSVFKAVDKNVPAGTYYYRIKGVSATGHTVYSNTQKISKQQSIQITGDATGRRFTVQHVSDKITIRGFDMTGRSIPVNISYNNNHTVIVSIAPSVTGLFLLHVQDGNRVLNKQLVLQ